MGIERIGLGIHRDKALRCRPRDPVFQRVEITNAGIGAAIDLHGFVFDGLVERSFQFERFADAARDGAKLHLLEKVEQGFRIRVGDGEVFHRDIDRHVHLQSD